MHIGKWFKVHLNRKDLFLGPNGSLWPNEILAVHHKDGEQELGPRLVVRAKLLAVGTSGPTAEVLGEGFAVYNPNDVELVGIPFDYRVGRQKAIDRALEDFRAKRGIRAGLKLKYDKQAERWDIDVFRTLPGQKTTRTSFLNMSEEEQQALLFGTN